MSEFWAKYKDPRWQKRRLEIMQRSNFQCETCESEEKTLNVHHKIYRKGADPWEYADHELQCLCEDCHENEHEIRNQIKECLAYMQDYDLERILGYLQGLIAFGDMHGGRPIKIRNAEHAMGVSEAISPVSMGAEEVIENAKTNDFFLTKDQLDEIWHSRWNRQRL